MSHKPHPLEGFRFQVEFKPRFADVDALGHVNHAKFFTYFEEARVAYLSSLGIFIPPASPLTVIIQKAECNYLKPVLHHHQVRVYLRAADWTRTRFWFHYALWLPEEDLLAASGSTKMVCWDWGQRKPALIPPAFSQRMRQFEQVGEGA